MNGKYMGWREQRWTARDPQRLARMRERREKKEKAQTENPNKKEADR